MRALGLVVESLERLDALEPILRNLGQRHSVYGVQTAHYDTVGAALLWTLEQGLGAEFKSATHAAWAEAYQTLASIMKNATLRGEAA